MKQTRPTILTVTGVMNIVVGSLALLCGLCGVGANLAIAGLANAPGPGGQPNPLAGMIDHLNRTVPGYQVVEIGSRLLVMLLGLLLVVAGIGLLGGQSWARWLSVFYALLMIPLQLGYLVYELGLVVPAVQLWEKQLAQRQGFGGMQGPQAAGQQVGTIVGIVGAGGLWIITALVILVMMFLPAMSAAFSGRRRRSVDRDDYRDDRDYDEYER